MVIPIERLSRPEKVNKYAGNDLKLNIFNNKLTLTVTGNNCKINLTENSGDVKVIGDSCELTVVKGCGSIQYIGNYGKITLGHEVPQKAVTYIGNNGDICWPTGKKLIVLQNYHKDVTKIKNSKKQIVISNATKVQCSTAFLPSDVHNIHIPKMQINELSSGKDKETSSHVLTDGIARVKKRHFRNPENIESIQHLEVICTFAKGVGIPSYPSTHRTVGAQWAHQEVKRAVLYRRLTMEQNRLIDDIESHSILSMPSDIKWTCQIDSDNLRNYVPKIGLVEDTEYRLCLKDDETADHILCTTYLFHNGEDAIPSVWQNTATTRRSGHNLTQQSHQFYSFHLLGKI
ncbi:hypothetical protein NQ317_008730 [Molorchus minor]|uniref:Uncharacterized protein n=1 Tax=Molorchus minor TaxID=1323400 RepID=A0ABQ9ITF0_9CUCU|nr:hypothetical protein NQ317_008730 [Molorchus minor]